MKTETDKENRKQHPIRRIFKWVIGVPAVILLLVLIGFLILTVLEYRPQGEEAAEFLADAESDRTLSAGDEITIATWNIGYGALGDNADFFMDGGTMVNTADQARVAENLTGISETLESISPDILFLQEIDRNSARSHHTDEIRWLSGDRSDPTALTGKNIVFAYNFRVPFVPFPIPPIGMVNSGIVTFSSYPITDATRIQLPCPFSWPIRTANLKRCLLVSRIPIDGSDRELVLVNLHLEAYDEGEGKIRQTKQLASLLEQEISAGNYVIAGGDFNQRFSDVDGSAYPILPGTWQCGLIDVSSFSEDLHFCMDNKVPSCRSLDRALDTAPDRSPDAFQYYLIDGFIVSDNLSVQSIETKDLGFVCSDHNPVVMKVRID